MGLTLAQFIAIAIAIAGAVVMQALRRPGPANPQAAAA
jgi:hypothetical protein